SKSHARRGTQSDCATKEGYSTAIPRVDFGLWTLDFELYARRVVARVTLEIALRKEFDYAIPPEMAAQIDVGTRVKVPFGPRQVNGIVTEIIEQSTHTNLRAIAKVISAPSLVTPKVLKLARWIADYYCCAPEIA